MGQRVGDSVLRAGLHCRVAETNTTLQGNYPPIKIKKKNPDLLILNVEKPGEII